MHARNVVLIVRYQGTHCGVDRNVYPVPAMFFWTPKLTRFVTSIKGDLGFSFGISLSIV
jgi:hypothetical protein